MTVGVVAAMPAEARWLARGRARARPAAADRSPTRVAVRVSGIGAEAATRAASALVAEGAQALVSWGTAAALDPALALGTIVVADRVRSADGVWFTPTSPWMDNVASMVTPVVRGLIACSPSVLRTSQDKRSLASQTGAIASDMESAAIAGVADAAGIPWIVVRAVSDGADDVLPASIIGAIDARGAFRWTWMIGGLLRRPADLRAFPALARGMYAAGQRLEWAATMLAIGLFDPACEGAEAWALPRVRG